MKFALINDEKTEATKGARGFCPSCGSELTAKCGEVNVHHWAHKGNRNCDPWWENETEWHRSWKGKFPKEWQEVVRYDKNSGEKHIADVKTESEWVLEFQHSHLNPVERRSRNEFYSKLVWVVDGTRLKRDKSKFLSVFDEGNFELREPYIRRVRHLDDCKLLQKWSNTGKLVFFDFYNVSDKEQSNLSTIGTEKVDEIEHLWYLISTNYPDINYLCLFPRELFIDSLNNNKFEEEVREINSLLQNEIDRNNPTQPKNELNNLSNMQKEIKRQLARQNRWNPKKRL